MNLQDYDVILVNTSGGKDSQTALDVVHKMAVEQGVADRMVAVHADLGRELLPVLNCLGRIQQCDVGKRIYRAAPGVYQAESQGQMERRQKKAS